MKNPTEHEHHLATDNLYKRRASQGHLDDNRTLENPIRDYTTHLLKCGYGRSVLDVGCGGQFLKGCIKKGTTYIPIDFYPAVGMEDCTIKMLIESDEALSLSAETVCAMAVLDNCLNFDRAISNMKQIAKRNIIILTGIGIDVDSMHTYKLQLIDFDSRFTDWNCTHREEIAPKVFLLNFDRP